jgi:hypothetical protein
MEVLAGRPVADTTIGDPTTPWFGVTVRLLIVVGIVKLAAVTPVNGSGATFGMLVGATNVIGVNCVSAPRAGATRKTEKSDTTTPFAMRAMRGEAIFVFMVVPFLMLAIDCFVGTASEVLTFI